MQTNVNYKRIGYELDVPKQLDEILFYLWNSLRQLAYTPYVISFADLTYKSSASGLLTSAELVGELRG